MMSGLHVLFATLSFEATLWCALTVQHDYVNSLCSLSRVHVSVVGHMAGRHRIAVRVGDTRSVFMRRVADRIGVPIDRVRVLKEHGAGLKATSKCSMDDTITQLVVTVVENNQVEPWSKQRSNSTRALTRTVFVRYTWNCTTAARHG